MNGNTVNLFPELLCQLHSMGAIIPYPDCVIVGASHDQWLPVTNVQTSDSGAVEGMKEDTEHILLDLGALLPLELVRVEQQVISESHQHVLGGGDTQRLDSVAAQTILLDDSLGEDDLLGGLEHNLLSRMRLLLQNIDRVTAIRANEASRVGQQASDLPSKIFYKMVKL